MAIGEPIAFAYFLEGGLSSNLMITREGRKIEVGCFGFEAMVSTATILNAGRSPHELLVQVGGPWLRIRAEALRSAIERSAAFLAIMLATRRSSVTLAVQAVEGYGAIRAKRARITVRDRGMLYDLAGESYGPAEAEYERLIGHFRDKQPPHSG